MTPRLSLSAGISVFALLGSLFVYFSPKIGLWGWCLEPGGGIKGLLMLGLYASLIAIGAVALFRRSFFIGSVLAALALSGIVYHYSKYGWIADTSIHRASRTLDPAFYALAAFTVLLSLGIIKSKPKPHGK